MSTGGWCVRRPDLLLPGLENVVFENILFIANDLLLLPPVHSTGVRPTKQHMASFQLQ